MNNQRIKKAKARIQALRAELHAKAIPLSWAYIRSCRRSLMADYVVLHPKSPAVQYLKIADGVFMVCGRKVRVTA